MKKIIALSLILAVMSAFTACSEEKEDTSSQPSSSAAEESVSESTADASGETPAKMLLGGFRSIMSDGGTHTPAEIADSLVKSEGIPFSGVSAEAVPGWLNGFDSEITGFKSGSFFGPMIGTIPFAGYIFELEEGADAEAFKNELNTKSNLAWNVCTQADEKVCESEGNMVFFVMAPASFDEEEEPQ